jgi:hypothetical protein
MRYDYFLIWGDGLPYINEITELIDQDFNFKIIFEKMIFFDNWETFIQDIYALDLMDKTHLIGKSQYLMDKEKRAYFLLVENKYPDIDYFGKNGYKHIECKKVKDLKSLIRNLYNPWLEDRKKIIEPLNPGVSHNHVIHASDNQFQTEYVLKHFNLPELEYFKQFSNKLDIKYFLLDMPCKYVILRMSENFPNYYKNSDVDILCDNLHEAINHIINKGIIYNDIENMRTYRIKQNNHYQLDFVKNGKLDIKFDLIDTFNFSKFSVNDSFKHDVLLNSTKKYNVLVTSIDFDCAIRYMEYIEHPEKIKHLEYCRNFGNKNNIETIIKKYTDIQWSW